MVGEKKTTRRGGFGGSLNAFLRKIEKKKRKEGLFPLFKVRGGVIMGQSIFVKEHFVPPPFFRRFGAFGARRLRRRPRFQSSWFQEERFEHI